jgi:small subunit ribosomal protein S17
MADETEQNENVEETEEAPVEEAPEAEAASDEVEASAEEETPAEEAPAEETVAEEAPAEDAPAEEPVTEAATDEPETEAAGEVEAEETAEAPAAEAAAEAEEATAAAAKPKKKRVPRSERRVRSKPKREKPAERKPITRLEKPEHERGRTQERQGKVVSAAMDKTIVVRVDTVKMHPRYKKVIRRSSKFHAHDEQNEAKVGDIVLIVETRPLSRMKRWRLRRVVEAAK